MKNRLRLWITLGILTMLLAACGSVGSKTDVIKCTGNQMGVSMTDGESNWVNGDEHVTGTVIKYNQESSCPELIGIFTVNINFTNTDESVWGTFYFETAYEGGGSFEGTLHAANNYKDAANGFSADATSYNATGSLRGLQLSLSVNAPLATSMNDPMPFVATIQNPPAE